MRDMRRPVTKGTAHHSFRKGEYLPYRATSTFHVGSVENLQVYADDVVEFDGYILRIGQDSYSAQNLRGAVKSGWLVPASDTQSVYRPASAGVVMTPADKAKSNVSHVAGTANTSEDERIVGNRADIRKRASISYVSEDSGVVVGKINVPAISDTKQLQGNNADTFMRNARMSEDSSQRASFNVNTEELRRLAAEVDFSDMTPEEIAEWGAKQVRRQSAEAEAEASRQARYSSGVDIQGPDPRAVAMENETSNSLRPLGTAEEWAEVGDVEISWGSGSGAIPFEDSNPKESSRAIQALDQVPRNPVSPAPQQPSQVVRTTMGVDWELGRPAHVRMQDAMERYGWSTDIILAIADVESGDVARFLRMAKGVAAPQVQSAVETVVKKAKAPKAPKANVIVSPSNWDATEPAHWASRLKKALEEYGSDAQALQTIAELEIPAVSKRLLEHAATISAATISAPTPPAEDLA